MDSIVNLCKQRGLVFQGSEIYGGMASTYDYGPLGVELANNVKQFWWKTFVQDRDDMVGQDASILLHPKVWMASGHVGGFSDPLMDCKSCKERWRADKLIESHLEEHVDPKDRVIGWPNEKTPFEEMQNYIKDQKIACPNCGACDYTDIRKFNLMFKTYQGVIENDSSIVYLRPETAQGIFVNFKAILASSRKKLPFGIAQIGKAFRNEITPGNFIFRVREFEQMEIEYFVKAEEWEARYDLWREDISAFLKQCGIKEENMRWREHEQDELSHYSSKTFDVEHKFPFGWGELWGLAYRGDFDLLQHQEHSGEDMQYFDPQDNTKFLPHCIEPSVGVGRLLLAILLNSYTEEQVGEETRVVMKFPYHLAPYKIAVLPLTNKLNERAKDIHKDLQKHFPTDFDTTQSIGKRYRRQDEIGTPFCITVDFDTLEDEAVTVRDRDTMEQERVKLSELKGYLFEKLSR
jgi:glycyl-tRNA synthetase